MKDGKGGCLMGSKGKGNWFQAQWGKGVFTPSLRESTSAQSSSKREEFSGGGGYLIIFQAFPPRATQGEYP